MWQRAVDLLVYDWFSPSDKSDLGRMLNFFIYDFFKVSVLIVAVVFVVSLLRTFVSRARLKELMNRRRFGTGCLIAAMFGAVTP
jgi:uncharacterized membrane protein YraQ (UPF0718 family)